MTCDRNVAELWQQGDGIMGYCWQNENHQIIQARAQDQQGGIPYAAGVQGRRSFWLQRAVKKPSRRCRR